MKTKTLQEQFNLINEGKGHKDVFIKSAKQLFPNKFRNAATFNEVKTKLINENVIGLPIVGDYTRPEESWETKFNSFLAEEAKAEEKKPSKEVEEAAEKAYNTGDDKMQDNKIFDQYLKGLRFEAVNAPDKSLEELKSIVDKNLDKNPLYYMEEAAFGVEGIGYTNGGPGLGEPKEIKGPHKSSGYGNLNEHTIALGISTTPAINSIPSLTDILNEMEVEETYTEFQRADKGRKDVDKKDKGEEDVFGAGVKKGEEIEKKKMKKESVKDRVKEIEKKGSIAALEAKMNALDEEIKMREGKLNMIDENEDLAEFVNPKKVAEMKKDIKELEKAKDKYKKMHEKMCGGLKQEIVDENTEG